MLPVMGEETELELLITIVLAAEDDRDAREACRKLVRRVGGRIVESGDCSDEEPGCWSVTLLRNGGESGNSASAAALSRSVRAFMRELGPAYSNARVSCEPPTAWTVVDDPELVGELVDGGERLLVEAWQGDSLLPAVPQESTRPEESADPEELGDPDEPAPETTADPPLDDVDESGRPRTRLGMVVDVLTERHSGAEWPARALASRVSRAVTVAGSAERPPAVRVVLDLGPFTADGPELVSWAASELGGQGWSMPAMHSTANTVAHWSTASASPSGIAAIELFAFRPEAVAEISPHSTAQFAAAVGSFEHSA